MTDPTLDQAIQQLAGEDLPLLSRLSVAGAFDAAVVERLGGVGQLDRLAKHPLVEGLAGETFRVREPFREALFRRLDTKERRLVSEAISRLRVDDPEETLFQGLVSKPRQARDRLRWQLKEPLERWDVAAAHRWLAVGREALSLVDAEDAASLREAVSELSAAIDTRSLWRRAWIDTSLYLEREATRNLWSDLTTGTRWALQLVAPGGVGKTTFLRALIARQCVSDGVAVALLDFDRDAWRADLVDDPLRLVRTLAEQLDPQLPGRPLRTHLESDTPIPESELGRVLAGMERRVLLVVDTTERLLVAHRAHVMRLWDLLAGVVGASGGWGRLILAGRHDLAGKRPSGQPEVPDFAGTFGVVGSTVSLSGFDRDEAGRYLHEVRGIEAGRIDELVRLAIPTAAPEEGANGLKLSLLADLVLTGALDEGVEGWDEVEVVHLIERVIERIEEPMLRWVVRWGSLADPLTRELHDEVLWPLLVEERSRDAGARLDLLSADKMPKQLAGQAPFGKTVPGSANAAQSPQEEQLASWEALSQYVTETSWVRPVQGDPDAVSFHITVRQPMRRLLEDQPIVRVFHERARQWFTTRVVTATIFRGMVEAARTLTDGSFLGRFIRRLAANADDYFDVVDVDAAAGAVYHAIELGPAVAQQAVHTWLLDADPTGHATRVAEVVLGARERGRPVADAWCDRAHAELAMAALNRGNEAVVREQLAAITSDENLAEGLVALLAGAITKGPEGVQLLSSASRSGAPWVRSRALEILGWRLFREGDRRAIEPLRQRYQADPTRDHRDDLFTALYFLERQGEAYSLFEGSGLDGKAIRGILTERVTRTHIVLEDEDTGAVRRALALGQLRHALELAGEGRRCLGLVYGAALLMDAAMDMLEEHPLDAAKILADSRLPDLAPQVRSRLLAIERQDPAEAALLRARIGDPVVQPGNLAWHGPTAEVRGALAFVLAGESVAHLVEVLEAVELPARRLKLLDGLHEAPAPDLSPLVPLVEAAGDQPLTPNARATLALVLGWGGRREVAAHMIRGALGEDLPVGAIRPWLRVHRALALGAEDLPTPQVDPESKLPGGSPLEGVVWLEFAEALRPTGDPRTADAFAQAAAHLADTPWRAQARPPEEAVHARRAVVEVTEASRTAWRIRRTIGRERSDVLVEHPADFAWGEEWIRELAIRLASAEGEVVQGLSQVAEVVERGTDRVALRGAPHLPWELASWSGFLHRDAPAGELRGGTRVLLLGGETFENRRVLDPLLAVGFDAIAPADGLASDWMQKFRPDIVLVVGALALQKGRVALVGANPRHGDTFGRLSNSDDGAPLLVVAPDTGWLTLVDRWHQLLLRNAWCEEAALSLPVVLGMGCVSEAQLASQLQTLADALRTATSLRECAERLRTSVPDPTSRATAIWTADPDSPWSPP